MENICLKCGIYFKVKPSQSHRLYCSKACSSKKITKPCTICGTLITRAQSSMTEKPCCSKACTKAFTSQNMRGLNVELNPTRMDLPTRTKLREARLNTGEGKSYEKTFGRHTHRIVAEEKLGRPLKKGEIVHHIDENRRNNHPDNLEILSSQADHARIHMIERIAKLKSNEIRPT